MRYYLDTEFSEAGYARIDLISIAVVCEDGREFYAVAGDGWDPRQCNPWVCEHVLPFVRPDGQKIDPAVLNNLAIVDLRESGIPVKSRAQIRKELAKFCFFGNDKQPEFWGYFADYDWVLLCQLFGAMIDLPKGFPMFCLDLKQEMERLGISRTQLPAQDAVLHNALADARWMHKAHYFIRAEDHRRRALLMDPYVHYDDD